MKDYSRFGSFFEEKGGFVSEIGARPTQQDTCAFAQDSELGVDFFGVFDGHGGDAVSSFLRKNYFKKFKKFYEGNLDEDFFIRMHADIDAILRARPWANYSGSTSVTAFIKQEGDSRFLTVANVGDSRVIVVRKKGGALLSSDHTPYLKGESERIKVSGGSIEMYDGVKKVYQLVCDKSGKYFNRYLAMTRSFGDFDITGITSEPGVMRYELTGDDLYLILASDGLWDVFTNERVAEIVREESAGGISSEKISRILASKAIDAGSTDNITVIVVKLAE
jgi:protein phosphatase 1L